MVTPEKNLSENELYAEKVTRMLGLARDLGNTGLFGKFCRSIWHKRKEDAIAFQMLAGENGLNLSITEPKPKPNNWKDHYYKLRPAE